MFQYVLDYLVSNKWSIVVYSYYDVVVPNITQHPNTALEYRRSINSYLVLSFSFDWVYNTRVWTLSSGDREKISLKPTCSWIPCYFVLCLYSTTYMCHRPMNYPEELWNAKNRTPSDGKYTGHRQHRNPSLLLRPLSSNTSTGIALMQIPIFSFEDQIRRPRLPTKMVADWRNQNDEKKAL